MQNSIKANKKINSFLIVYFYFFIAISVVITLLPWWPALDFLIIPKYLLLFGPRWWLLLMFIPLLFFVKYFNKKYWAVIGLLILLSFNYLDFQVPKYWKILPKGQKKQHKLSVITFNIGGGGSTEELQSVVKYMKPDILLLQEARRINLGKLFKESYYSECISGLCILSKYPFKQTKSLNRKVFGGWGKFAVFYQITTPFGILSLANVHLETPRSVLMGVIYRAPDFSLAKAVEDNRQLEVDFLKRWSNNKPLVLIAGDFNMPSDENIFHQNLSSLNNAVDDKGAGFNYTKFTSWYGVRIDHILYSNNIFIESVEVVELVKGDHRPLMATFLIEN
jgi:endonuclease/exonuclease/phosphatase (EEP) superfamily protein YafD